MADTADLIEKIVDLKIERAVGSVLREMQKLADAHNHVAGTVIPPLVADLERRTAAEHKTKDDEIAALRAEIERLRAEKGRTP